MTCVFCGLPAETKTGNHYQSTECIAALKAEKERLEQDNKRWKMLSEKQDALWLALERQMERQP